MGSDDHTLGMGRKITRRDFLHGAVGSVVAGAALGSGCASRSTPTGGVGLAGVPADPSTYPPSRLGMRGSHRGSFEVAHEMALSKRSDWGTAGEPDPDDYDLVVVGAGVSGLAAAVFWREQHPAARVLVLDNHDDFGGHAKRNEFAWGGRTILGYGGSQSFEEPSAYSDVAKGLLSRLGVEPSRIDDAYDDGFYRRHGLGPAIYFDREHYGVDRLVRSTLIDPSGFLPVAPTGASLADSIDEMPLSEPARRQLLAIATGSRDRVPDHSVFGEADYLWTISYRDFLTKHLGVDEPEVLTLLQDASSLYYGHGIDVTPAFDALSFGLPGMGSTSLGTFEGLIRGVASLTRDPYTYHFPDGNASVARLLVRRLIPDVAPGDTMEDVVTSAFDYSALDRAASPVRLRLASTVVRVRHDGDPRLADRVDVTYVRDGKTQAVRARRVVLACYNAVVPYLCPELPAPQREALASLVKIPLVYNNVLLRDWHSIAKLGVAVAHCPGTWNQLCMVDFPVSMGDYRFSGGPSEPIVLHMSRTPTRPGLPPNDQSRSGRAELLTTSFETIEREIRTHLAGMLGAAGFDPARDIEAIVVNRWPHGYAPEPNPLFDPEYAPGEAPHEIGRRRFGRVAIANSDAGARAYLDAAIDQAWRAVGDLS
jgi:spermidine dehydrogenase